MSASSPGPSAGKGSPAARNSFVKNRKATKEGAAAGAAATAPPGAVASSSNLLASPPMSPEAEWEQEANEEEEKRVQEEKAKRQELEEIRRAEMDWRKARDRERLAAEEESRRRETDRQKMIEALERPMVELLERLQCFETLGMLLAENQVLSLKRLTSMPRAEMIQVFGSSNLPALDRMVGAARRSVALDDIARLKLPEDAEWEAENAAKTEADREAHAIQMRKAEQGYGVFGGGKKKTAAVASAEKEEKEESLADQIAKRWAVVEKPPTREVGPLRKELAAVVNRWYDYLATVPSRHEVLARATAEYLHAQQPMREVKLEADDVDAEGSAGVGDDEGPMATAEASIHQASTQLSSTGWNFSSTTTRARKPLTPTHISGDVGASGPTWKDTVSWALWMLTRGSSRRQIEKYLKLIQEHVWKCLYPALEQLGGAEWRVYWQRVNFNFEGFFSNRGTDKWKQVAAADARAKAIREGKDSAAQDAAAAQAERLVGAMLQPPARRRGPQRASTESKSPGKRLVNVSLKGACSSRLIAAKSKRNAPAENVPTEVAVAVIERYVEEPTESPTRFAQYDASPNQFVLTRSRYLDALSRPHSGVPPAIVPQQLPFGDQRIDPRSPDFARIPSAQLFLPPPPPSSRRLLRKARSASSVLEGGSLRARNGSGGQRSHRGGSGRIAYRV